MNAPFSPLHLPASARAQGDVRAEFAHAGGRTHVARLHEAGGLRLRFPRTREGCEAVLVNTGGGVAGGDRARLAFRAGAGADVTLTTQSAEKIYRAQEAHSDISLDLTAGAGARLEWLPQETILFDGARLRRSFTLDAAADARVTLLEATVFGRLAMGERDISGFLADRWRLRRGGRLVYADDLRLEGPIAALLDRAAIGDGARASGVVVHVAPEAETLLEGARAALEGARCEVGASAWDGMLVVRLLAREPGDLRAALTPLLTFLCGRAAPRVWQ